MPHKYVAAALIATLVIWFVGWLTRSWVLDLATVISAVVTIGLYFLYGEVKVKETK